MSKLLDKLRFEYPISTHIHLNLMLLHTIIRLVKDFEPYNNTMDEVASKLPVDVKCLLSDLNKVMDEIGLSLLEKENDN